MILTADYLLTGDSFTIIKNGAVYFKKNVIEEVGTKEILLAKYPEEEVKEYQGATLMPGLIDLHNHFAYRWGQPDERKFTNEPYTLAFWMCKQMKDTLKRGVTTVRDVSSPDNIGPNIKWASEKGYIDAPRIFTSGKGVCMTGGHGWGLEGGTWQCDGEQEVIKAVRTNVRDGANCIKILTSEGYRGLEMSQEEINAAANEAHRLGVTIASHAGYDPSIQMSIDAGCDTIEHGTHLTMKQALYMKEHNQTWVPTIFVFKYVNDLYKQLGDNIDFGFKEDPRKYLQEACECYKNNFKKLYDAGVRVAVGTDTDCAGYPGVVPVVEECKMMVEYGITPLQAIECATKNGAEALHKQDEFGMLKAGLAADVIVIKGKPFEDIAALNDVLAVYLEGQQKI